MDMMVWFKVDRYSWDERDWRTGEVLETFTRWGVYFGADRVASFPSENAANEFCGKANSGELTPYVQTEETTIYRIGGGGFRKDFFFKICPDRGIVGQRFQNPCATDRWTLSGLVKKCLPGS